MRMLAGAVAAAALMGMAGGAHAQSNAELLKRIEKLEAEVAIQKDIEDIRRLQFAYNYYNSSRLYAQVMDLVADNPGSIEIAGRGVYKGRKGFEKNFHPDADGVVRDKGVEFGFVLFQLAGMDIINVAPDRKTAKARVRVMTNVYSDFPDTRPRFNGGDYEMQFVKERGLWKIYGMKYVHNYSVTYAKDGTVRPGYSTPPDGAADGPTTWYHPWPETGVLPFESFVNPVTGKVPPDVAGKEQYWIGNWPGEFGKTGVKPLPPKAAAKPAAD